MMEIFHICAVHQGGTGNMAGESKQLHFKFYFDLSSYV